MTNWMNDWRYCENSIKLIKLVIVYQLDKYRRRKEFFLGLFFYRQLFFRLFFFIFAEHKRDVLRHVGRRERGIRFEINFFSKRDDTS